MAKHIVIIPCVPDFRQGYNGLAQSRPPKCNTSVNGVKSPDLNFPGVLSVLPWPLEEEVHGECDEVIDEG